MERKFLLYITFILQFHISFHKGQRYLWPDCQQCSIPRLYFVGIYSWIAEYFWKEVTEEGVIYNSTFRVYCNIRLPNENLFINRTLWVFNGCTKFNKRRDPYQDVPFFYTPSHLSELKKLSQIYKPISLLFSH